tara:strand:+ start:241 stop:507 length:267 start_codon:yes stop_codon:yes gene_type:complete
MDKVKLVDEIIDNLLENELERYKLKRGDYFSGINSEIDSIDILSSVSYIEDELEKSNIILIDLFEKIFEKESLTFDLLRNFILEIIEK